MKKFLKIAMIVVAAIVLSAVSVFADECVHELVPIRTEPTCTEPGQVVYICSKCQTPSSVVVTLDPLGHNWSETRTTNEAGASWIQCTRCDEKKDYVAPTQGSCGTGITWKLESGTLTISGTGSMNDFSGVNNVPWRENVLNVTAISLSGTLKSIGKYAFSGMANLKSISVPASVEKIGGYAFFQCGQLETVTIAEGSAITSIGEGAFWGCGSLKTITLPTTLKTIGLGAFSGTQIASVEIPASVTFVDEMAFDFCSSLTKVTFLSAKTAIGDSSYTFPKSTVISAPSGSTAQAYATKYGRVFVSTDVTELPKPAFQQGSLLLESDISIKFYLRKESVKGYDSFYTVFKKAVYDEGGNVLRYETVKVTDYEEKSAVSSTGAVVECYVFTMSGIAAKEMASEVEATGYGVKGGVETAGDPVNYSVLKYATNQLARTSDAKFRTLLVDLLNYGAEAQKNFKYNTKLLANADLTSVQQGYASGSVSLTSVKASNDLSGASMKIRQATLLLEEKVKVNYYLQKLSYSGDVSDLSLKITYKSEGKDKEVVIRGSDFTPSGSEYIATFDGLAAKEMSVSCTATLCKGSTPVSNTVTYSVESYAASKKDDPSLSAITSAMMKYGKSTAAYFGN